MDSDHRLEFTRSNLLETARVVIALQQIDRLNPDFVMDFESPYTLADAMERNANIYMGNWTRDKANFISFMGYCLTAFERDGKRFITASVSPSLVLDYLKRTGVPLPM